MIDLAELDYVEVDALHDKALAGDKDAIDELASIVRFIAARNDFQDLTKVDAGHKSQQAEYRVRESLWSALDEATEWLNQSVWKQRGESAYQRALKALGHRDAALLISKRRLAAYKKSRA